MLLTRVLYVVYSLINFRNGSQWSAFKFTGASIHVKYIVYQIKHSKFII